MLFENLKILSVQNYIINVAGMNLQANFIIVRYIPVT